MEEEIRYPRGVEVIGSTYILNDKNQILMTKHYRWDGIWLITGGHIEPGESIENAVKREAKEELNLDVEVLSFISVGEFFTEPPLFKRPAHFIFVNYLTRMVGGEIKLGDEIKEYKWFDIDDAIALENIKETTREPLIKIREMLRSGL